jgi:hypothetical protein
MQRLIAAAHCGERCEVARVIEKALNKGLLE